MTPVLVERLVLWRSRPADERDYAWDGAACNVYLRLARSHVPAAQEYPYCLYSAP